MSDASMLPVQPSPRVGRFSARRTFQLVALVFTVIGAVAAVTLPLYTSSSISTGSTEEVTTTATFLEVNGPGALIPVLIPVLVAAAPLFAREATRAVSVVAAVLLVVFVVIAGFSIGLFYLPAAIVAVIAALLPARRPQVVSSGS